MADWPLSAGTGRLAGSTNAAGTSFSNIGNSSWGTLIDPVPFECAGVWLHFGSASSGQDMHAVDLGIGPNGAETVIVPALIYESRRGGGAGHSIFVPIAVPKGVRLAVRPVSLIMGGSLQIGAHLVPVGFHTPQGFQWCEKIANRVGQVYGNNNEAPGSWVAFGNPTTRRVRALIFQINYWTYEWPQGNFTYMLDIGVGSGVNDVSFLVPQLRCHLMGGSGTAYWGQPILGPFPVDIKPGSQLFIRKAQNVLAMSGTEHSLHGFG